MNDPIEDLFRQELQRVEAPPELRDRVLRALPPPRHSLGPPISKWTAPVAAAALLAISVGAGWRHLEKEQIQARQARREALYALQLTSNKLAAVDVRLRRSSPEIFLKERSK